MLPLLVVLGYKLRPFMQLLILIFSQMGDILVNYSLHLGLFFDANNSAEFVVLLPVEIGELVIQPKRFLL
jgi:hypothetical protein